MQINSILRTKMTNSITTRNIVLILETLSVYAVIGFAAISVHNGNFNISPFTRWVLYFPLVIFMGLWVYRFYIVAHEAAHRKLFVTQGVNDFWGSFIALPLLVPIFVFRKIHFFHHGYNRKDDNTAALDTIVIKGKPSTLKKFGCYMLWYFKVFGGGFFIHSLLTVLIFLFLPLRVARKLSPAFKGWTVKDQIKSIALFLLGCSIHLLVLIFLGKEIYLPLLGFPLLAFAWLYSLMVYVFHYKTTKGNLVQYNVRSLNTIPFFSWLLCNFNEHATHHQNPSIPWFELAIKKISLPQEFADKNKISLTLLQAILQQRKGPEIKVRNIYK